MLFQEGFFIFYFSLSVPWLDIASLSFQFCFLDNTHCMFSHLCKIKVPFHGCLLFNVKALNVVIFILQILWKV